MLVLMGPPTLYIARRQCISLLHNTVMLYDNMYAVYCILYYFTPNTSSNNRMAQVALNSIGLHSVLVFMKVIILVIHSHHQVSSL